jgi:hypothetical protein
LLPQSYIWSGVAGGALLMWFVTSRHLFEPIPTIRCEGGDVLVFAALADLLVDLLFDAWVAFALAGDVAAGGL